MRFLRRQDDTPIGLLASGSAALAEDEDRPRPDQAQGRLEGEGVTIQTIATARDRARATRLRKQKETDERLAKRMRGARRALSAEATPVNFRGVPVEDLPRPPQPA
jgi:hypothetical protein